jgi:transcription antitermination factor NusG
MGELKMQSVASTSFIKDNVVNQLSETDKRWFAVYTKFKCEKYVSDAFCKKHIDCYVPLVTRVKRYERKIKRYEVPLINCYVFVCITKNEYLSVLETEYVMKFLRQGKDLLSIPEHEIEILRRVVGDVESAEVVDCLHLSNGEEVEVISGHLTGLQGKIVSKVGKKSFMVELNTLGYQLMINIDFKLLKPVKNRATFG